MFKLERKNKKYLNSNDLIQKSMIKRRRLANAAIARICDVKFPIRVVK